jgi:hypothetical protein
MRDDQLFDLLGVVLVVLLLYRLFPFVLGPILVHTNQRVAAHPAYEPFDPDAPETPTAVADFLRQTRDELAPEGFALLGHFFQGSTVPKVMSFVTLFHNPRSLDSAMAAALYARTEQGTKMKGAYVEFFTRFQDEVRVVTNNSTTLRVFAPVPGKTVVSVPQIDEADKLWRIHQAVLRVHGSLANKVAPLEGTVLESLQKSLTREMTGQVEAGYYYLDEDADAYRPTWKGAILMTWKLVWPVGPIRRALRLRRAARLLDTLQW